MPPRPNLFLIGAMKAGTSSLHSSLGTHPDIFMSRPKEPCFFLDPALLARTWPGLARFGIAGRTDRYLELFAGAGEAAIRGESSTPYTKMPLGGNIAPRIAAFSPDAFILYAVRDPIQRTISHYWQWCRNGREHRPCLDAVREVAHYTEVSRYAFQLKPYLENFPRRQIKVVPLERFIAEGDAVLREICHWLGVDPAAMPGQASREPVNVKPAVFRQQGPFQRWVRRVANTPSWLRVRPLVPRFVTRPLGRFARGGRERSTSKAPEGVAELLRPRLQEDAARLFELCGEDFSSWWPTLFPQASSRPTE